MKTLLSGIQPSGSLHIGNYLGAIRHWAELQKTYDAFITLVDLHAITVPQDPAQIHAKTLETAALLLACGIDKERAALFIQSHVPAHTELGWILTTLAPVGELERMTQYKDKRDRSGALAGLLMYPVLQAADILLYQPDAVPVGEDQLQHLELTRTLAEKFNARFGPTFKTPKPLIQKDTGRIMGLDDPAKKMSKSAPRPENYVALLDAPEDIRRKIKIAVTDSGKDVVYDEKEKPAISNLIRIFSAFSELSHAEVTAQYRGKGYAEFKKDLAELLVEKLAVIQKKYHEYSRDQESLLALLHKGAARARETASPTLHSVKEKVGLVI